MQPGMTLHHAFGLFGLMEIIVVGELGVSTSELIDNPLRGGLRHLGEMGFNWSRNQSSGIFLRCN